MFTHILLQTQTSHCSTNASDITTVFRLLNTSAISTFHCSESLLCIRLLSERHTLHAMLRMKATAAFAVKWSAYNYLYTWMSMSVLKCLPHFWMTCLASNNTLMPVTYVYKHVIIAHAFASWTKCNLGHKYNLFFVFGFGKHACFDQGQFGKGYLVIFKWHSILTLSFTCVSKDCFADVKFWYF